MSNWFDENNHPTEKNSNDTNTSSGSSESTDKNSSVDSGWKSTENTASNQWASDGNTYKSNANAKEQSDPKNATPPSSESTNSTTYHYGVNSPNQVPNGTNDYRQQQQYTPPTPPNNYRPQGNYDPYGWQQMQNQPGTPPPKSPKPKKKKNGATIAIATLSVVCAAAIITLSVLLAMAVSKNDIPNTNGVIPKNSSSNASANENPNAPSLQIAEEQENAQGLSTRSIVDMNLSSTVVITTYMNQQPYDFGNSGKQSQAGSATGIVMTTDGYIITNRHVVINEKIGKPYDRIDVKTYDGTEYENAEIIGVDQFTDLAVIKIGAANLSPAKFGDSSGLHLGDKVVAIGNAGGLSWTTTQGIVSGLARDVYEDTGYAIKCLQIDAAINPGNSGGPLLNSQGQVVGINSAKIVASGYEGLGFSIPINEAKTIIDDLVKYGYVKGRVMLGITGRTITQPGYEGFRIEEISSNSCLANTNAKVGDIITHIDGIRVKDYSTMRTELSKHKVGDTIELTLMRVDPRTGNTSSYKIKCTLAESKRYHQIR